ncbi:cytochrome P450 [Marimonas arenosa]|uniref:Cytochrome P450 n=1 Tax=Marimonas arenosa TaxID=1795305 RepID=A0AAE4B6I2_9RHOB|nr:cytochrome P450 [Marimonas arenosa]MDQ2091369.1 cytochrome P450 [Marimonas arenosa]
MKALFDEYTKQREQAPIHIIDAPGGPRYCIYRYEDVAAAFKDQCFGGAQTPPHLLRLLRWIGLSALANAAEHGFFASLNAPDHTRIRKVMDPAFAPRAIKAREPLIEHIVGQFIDLLDGREEFDLVAEFAAPLPAWVIADVFGFPPAEMDSVRRWTDDLLPMVDPEVRKNTLLRSLMAFFKFRRRVLQLVAERNNDPKEDLLSALADAFHRSGTITRDEMVGSAALALTAGHVTTRHLLTNCVRLLLENPTALERAKQEPDTLETVIEETARLLSPLQTTGRVTTEDVELAGQKIPRGSKVRIFIGSANHDPRRFENPDEFDIDRAAARHMGFGGGIHYCIGIHLARVEVKIALRELFRRFPNLSPVEDGIHWGASRKFLGVSRFPVRTNV